MQSKPFGACHRMSYVLCVLHTTWTKMTKCLGLCCTETKHMATAMGWTKDFVHFSPSEISEVAFVALCSFQSQKSSSSSSSTGMLEARARSSSACLIRTLLFEKSKHKILMIKELDSPILQKLYQYCIWSSPNGWFSSKKTGPSTPPLHTAGCTRCLGQWRLLRSEPERFDTESMQLLDRFFWDSVSAQHQRQTFLQFTFLKHTQLVSP